MRLDGHEVPAGTLKGWADRKTGESSESFLEYIERDMPPARSLMWFVNPYSRWPIWLQLILLWIKSKIFRRAL